MVHRRGGRSNKSGTQSDSGGVGLVDEKELEWSDFSVTDTEDEDLFTTHVEHDKNYMSNWWGKFVGDGYRAEGGSDGGSEYADSEELLSLYGSDDETTSQRRTRYHEFNEKHDMRIPIVLEKGLLFADTYVFKMALKWYDVLNQFDFKFKHNDKAKVVSGGYMHLCVPRRNQYRSRHSNLNMNVGTSTRILGLMLNIFQ
jgi:hypothetical protein